MVGHAGAERGFYDVTDEAPEWGDVAAFCDALLLAEDFPERFRERAATFRFYGNLQSRSFLLVEPLRAAAMSGDEEASDVLADLGMWLCPACGGSGEIETGLCEPCDAFGWVHQEPVTRKEHSTS